MAFYNGKYVGLTINNGCIIEAGKYRLVDVPNTDVEPCNGSYFFADMSLHNCTKLSWSHGVYINNGQIMLLTAPQSIIGTLGGTAIYTDGAYVDTYSQRYDVACDTVVPQGFFDWWNANTVKE